MKRVILASLSILWISLMVGGIFYLMRYSNTPGASARAPSMWPEKATIARSQESSTLILFGHPQCPCTAASIGELNEIVAHAGPRLKVYVAFVTPKGASDEWRDSRLWDNATAIPGVTALIDEDGSQAALFGAQTSGQVMLYNEKGELVFSGGITGGRGHSGDNLGKDAVVSYANHKKIIAPRTPVYGCALYMHEKGA